MIVCLSRRRPRVRVPYGAPRFRMSTANSKAKLFGCLATKIILLFLFRSSTAVVQLTVNQLVVGSIPASGAIYAGVIQLVECFLAKEDVESSSLFARSSFRIVTAIKKHTTCKCKSKLYPVIFLAPVTELVYVLVLEAKF